MTTPGQPWQDVRALPQRLAERLTPKQRQYAMLCTLMAGGVGLLWSIFAFTDNGQKIGVVPSSGGQPPAVTNIGVMPPGEVPSSSVIIGGSIVIGALALNELLGARQRNVSTT